MNKNEDQTAEQAPAGVRDTRQQVSIGRVLHYVLGPHDPVHARQRGGHRPFHVTAVHSPDCVSGQVTLDPNDATERSHLGKTSVGEGTAEGSWHWPERTF